jgi:methyl-accepting chemotaxis protein
MDIFEKFAPYNSLFRSDQNTLTAWWVVGTILVMLIASIMLWYRLRSSRSEVRKQAEFVNAKTLKESKLLGDSWSAYAHTFLSTEGERQKTPEFAEEYFNTQTVLPSRMNLRLYLSVPNVLVGFGILGTFVGLTFGISGFDTSSADTIKKSIQTLLSGMGTAFVSSVWGMLLSLFFGWFEKLLFKGVDRDFETLSKKLNERFRLTKSDELKFKREDTIQLLESYFAYKTEDGKPVVPGTVFKDLRHHAAEQSKALKSFSTDLADGIRISTQTINQLGEHISANVGTLFKEDVAPSLERLSEAADELRQTKEQSSAEVIERVVGSLQMSLNDMIRQVQTSLSGTAKTEMENLAAQLTTAVGALGTFPGTVQSMMKSLETSMDSLQALIKDASAKANEEAAASAALMREQVEQTAAGLASVIRSLQDQSQVLLTNQSQNTTAVQETVRGSQEMLQKAHELYEKMNQMVSGIGKVMDDIKLISRVFNETGTTLMGSADNLNKTTAIFRTQSQEFINFNQQTLKEFHGALDKAKLTVAEYSQKFGVIQQGLVGVFDGLKNGLIEYQSVTKQNLNGYLQEFTSHLVDASKSLSGTISDLESSMEEMNDSFEKLTSTIRNSNQ